MSESREHEKGKCAHATVKYIPISLVDGYTSPRWLCASGCGTEFEACPLPCTAPFQVGDEVEVLPATEKGCEAWERVEGLRGVVVRGALLSVGVQFRGWDGGHNLGGALSAGDAGWWCDPAWLRRVQDPHEGAPGTTAAAAPRMYQDWGEAGRAAAAFRSHYAPGDRVDMGEFKGGVVLDADVEPRYSVRWPSGHVQRIRESNLRPAGLRGADQPSVTRFKVGDRFLWNGKEWEVRVGPFENESYVGREVGSMWMQLFHSSTMFPKGPGICAPDGTRCEARATKEPWFGFESMRYCPDCGRKLGED